MMKRYIFLLVILSVILVFASCKKDRETPYEPPTDKYYFTGKVKNLSKSFTEDVNGYRLYKAGGCGTDGVDFYATYGTGFKQESGYYILSNEKIRISFKNVYKKANWNGDSLFNHYFKVGDPIPWYSMVNIDTTVTDTLTIYGVEISWIDGEGKFYSTKWGDQSSSMFVINETALLTSGVSARVKAQFNCNVYDRLGNYLVMKECELLLPFEEPCF